MILCLAENVLVIQVMVPGFVTLDVSMVVTAKPGSEFTVGVKNRTVPSEQHRHIVRN